MMRRKAHGTILIFCLCVSSTFAQVSGIDSLSMPADTIGRGSISSVKVKQYVGVLIPLTMVGYGIASISGGGIETLDFGTRNELIEDNTLFYNGFDDYLQFSPAIAALVLNLSGVEGKHKLGDMAVLYALSNLLESGIVYSTKNIVKRERPDGSARNSFPSGHTATAFVAAEFLHQEYGSRSVWISVGGYGMASLIGISRVYNNKHWLSDVVAGAGIGILCTKGVYWLYPHLQKTFCPKSRKVQTVILPSYSDGLFSLTASLRF